MPTITLPPGLSGIISGLGNVGSTLGGLVTGKINLTDIANKAWAELKKRAGQFVGSLNLWAIANRLWAEFWKRVNHFVGSINLGAIGNKLWMEFWKKVNKITGGFNLNNLAGKAWDWAKKKVSNITGSFSLSKLASDAGGWLKSKINSINMTWPWGPRSKASAEGKFQPRGPSISAKPRGPFGDIVARTTSAIAGIDYKYIKAAADKGYRGMGAFENIANGIASRLHYSLYMNTPKSDQKVWSDKSTNCMDGAEFLINEANHRMNHRGNISGSMSGRGYWGGWPHRWAVVNGKGYDIVNKMKHGTWTPHNEGKRGNLVGRFLNVPAFSNLQSTIYGSHYGPPMGPHGSQEELDYFMSNIGSALSYVGYGGHGKNPYDALVSGGNCFDMTLGIMGVASQLFGVPAKMMWGTYQGNSHVWAKLGGKDYDLSRRALEGTYTPPPSGPGGGGTTIIIQGDCYGYDDFVKQVEKANNTSIRRTW
jgi:hypothetical protein